MRARVALEPAYLLSGRPYSDSSLLVEAFTRNHGRVGLVARGARSQKSALRGVLQSFTPLLLSWSERGELGSLQNAEAAGPAAGLGGERVFHGWYLNELLLRLLQRHDAHAPLFDRYALALSQLAGEAAMAEEALRVFEKHLLAELGYGLLLPGDLDAARRYRYDPEQGPLPLAGDAPDSYGGASLIGLREEHLPDAAARSDARRLLRAALAPHLGSKPLQTPRLLRELRQSQGNIRPT